MATEKDLDLLFQWANDEVVRENSYNRDEIDYQHHVKWFNKRINSDTCSIYIFTNEQNIPVGQVRFEKEIKKKEAIVGIIVDARERGKGYSIKMLNKASTHFLEKNSNYQIFAFIMKTNHTSYNCFINAGYKLLKEDIVKDFPSLILYKN